MAFALFPLAAAPVLAQEVLQEVVVTAQKRQQNIQDVPITMAAFTGVQLQALGATSSYDVAAFTPGVFVSGNLAGQNTQFSVRGVTQNDFNDIIESPNAVYIDEGYVAVAQAQTFGLFDIDRVEILKGPQGTLFGRNATGGLVQYITNKPSFDKVEGYTDVSGYYYDTAANAWGERVEAGVGGPFSDRVAGRVAGFFDNQDGYLKNVYPQDAPPAGSLGSGSPGPGAGANLGGDESYAVRGTLDVKPEDTLLLRLSVNQAHSILSTGAYQGKPTTAVLDKNGNIINVINTPANDTRLSIQGSGDGGGNFIDGTIPLSRTGFQFPGFPVTARPVPGGDFFGYPGSADSWTTSSAFAFKNNGSTNTTGVNGRVEWDLGGGTQFVSITDWKKYNKSLFVDVAPEPANLLANYAGVDATSLTQELRLSGKTGANRWVGGFYYLYIDNLAQNGLKGPVNSILATVEGLPLDIGISDRLRTNSASLFGQLEHDFTDTLTGTLGARVIREDKNYAMLNNGFFISQGNFSFNQGQPLPNVPVPGAPFRYTAADSRTLWAGKVQLDWRPQDGLLVYG
ncbi:MAG: TonB-dependent receptor plug domain-containing protein, partial [Steroidobacteraceae bacterium]